MAELHLEVIKASLKGEGSNEPVELGAVVRLRRLDGPSGETSVAVGVGTTTRVSDLAGGAYEVQLFLPSGKILAQEIELAETGTGHLAFDAGGSPSASLGWQHYAGAVPNRASFPDLSINLKGFVQSRPLSSPGTISQSDDEPFFAGATKSLSVLGKPKLLMIETPPANEPIDDDGPKALENWELLARGVSGDVRAVQMIRGFKCQRQVAQDEIGGRDSWRFGFAPDRIEGRRTPRRFALVQLDTGNELVSLPLPWRNEYAGGDWRSEDFVDLLVDTSSAAKRVRASVLVRDAKYGGIIAYMSNGGVSLAGEMIRADNGIETRAIDMLGAKSLSPLGACAAAYVLLSTMSLADDASQRWLGWIENLGRSPSYSWIPDAALLRARVKLQTAETADEAREAIPLLLRSLRSGLPFYSLGLSWMLEALTHFRDEDSFIGEIFPLVEKVAGHLDISQAFLVLKIEKGTS